MPRMWEAVLSDLWRHVPLVTALVSSDVALLVSESQILHGIASALRYRDDMIDFRSVRLSAQPAHGLV